jgi:ferric-dicitrate binding protein FerR (iron transport regulator)
VAEMDELLQGWGGPEPKPDFADRVLQRVDADSRRRRARRWAGAFAIGAVVGGLGVAAITSWRATLPRENARELHVQVPGVVDVVGEPGSHLEWERDASGTIAIEVVRGVAWVRAPATGSGFVVIADGDAVELGGACVRVEVVRGFLSVDVEEDAVACAEVEAAIERAAAELSGPRSR